MKLYISSHHAASARLLANALIARGHAIVSTWHETDDKPPTDDAAAWRANAQRNFRQIGQADALVLIAGPDLYTGGKFVEAGYALAQGNPVLVLGRVENGMLHHPSVFAFNSITALSNYLMLSELVDDDDPDNDDDWDSDLDSDLDEILDSPSYD